MMSRFTPILSGLVLAAIRAYQAFLSPLMWSACRYYPTCSHYTHEAIEMYGLGRGMWLGLNRLLRCHPFTHRQGYDPVPEPVRSVFLSPDDPAKRDWGEESQPLSALRSPRARHLFVRREKDGRSSAAEALL